MACTAEGHSFRADSTRLHKVRQGTRFRGSGSATHYRFRPELKCSFALRRDEIARYLCFPFALSLYQFSTVIDGYAGNRTERELEMVARVPAFTDPSQRTPGDQVG